MVVPASNAAEAALVQGINYTLQVTCLIWRLH
jgi:hypothetical protein